jgi:hypothetical protein
LPRLQRSENKPLKSLVFPKGFEPCFRREGGDVICANL